MNLAVYPGSFDPITWGHVDIIRRVHAQFESLVVLIANSSRKNYLFTLEERRRLVQECLSDLSGVQVDTFDGLTVEYLKKKNATVIVRGLRTVSDFDSEMAMAHINKKLRPEAETLLVFANPEFQAISSHMVKEAATFGADLSGLIPPSVEQALHSKYKAK
jgi:pantetheine-phosphate adenylyltransferase